MKNTIVVNLIGGQGTGKSSIMGGLFSWLKFRNIDCEMCTEFAKELVWEGRKDTFKDELYIFAKQNHRLFRCNGKVEVIITDRPLILSIPYNEYYGGIDTKWNESYNNMVLNTYNLYNNLNIYLNRIKPYNHNGRNESEDIAIMFDKSFKHTLDKYKLKYDIYDGVEESIPLIGEYIISRLEV